MALTGAASWEDHEYSPGYDDYSNSGGVTPRNIDTHFVEEEQPEPRTLKEHLIDYANRTTLHGYSYIVQPTPFILRRILWGVYIALSTIYFLTYASEQLIQYLEFQKNSLVEVQYRSNVSFPSITICNQNPFRLSALIDAGWYETANLLAASANETVNCGEEGYKCVENGRCIDRSFVCDRFPDCDEASEEQSCGSDCSLIRVSGDGGNSTPAFGKLYRLHNTGLLTGGALYITQEEPFIYLYHEDGLWLLTDKHDQGFIYAKLEYDNVAPVMIGTQEWLVNINNNWVPKTASITCALAFPELLSFPKGTVYGTTDMLTMYENASHRVEDMLTSCIWKGKYPCEEVGNVTSVMTTMGKCFTIEFNEPIIDNPGPDSGLSLTLNIQQYEYLKGSGQGLGLKLLLHEPEVAPSVRELGLALSPGIVSQLVLETTKVKNLKPPWGDCVDLDLKYYDDYDKSKCILECETNYLEEKCGCRIFYMPHIDNWPPSCDVDTYLQCAKPEIDAFRATEDYCSHCGERCVKMNYVSSSSFALMGAELGDAQNLRTYSLGKELLYAREKAYRHLKPNYQRTLKAIHQIANQIAQTVKFFDILERQTDIDFRAIFDASLLVKYDCGWSRDLVRKVNRELDSGVTKTLDDARLRLRKLIAKSFPAVDRVAEAYLKLIEDFKTEHRLAADQPFYIDFRGCEADCRQTAEGFGYVGSRSRTVSGRQCQRWDKQTPHAHKYTEMYDDRFPERDIRDARNLCRNPDRKPTGPWCYTTDPDVEWETCQIPICSDCLQLNKDYRGNRRLTLSGRTCQRWDSQSPHQHSFTAGHFPDSSLAEAENFCRNPDQKPTGPWCYTTDPDKEWETCALPMCHDCKRKNLGTDYMGTKAVTMSGIPCQRWDMQYPHRHSLTDVSRYPDTSLEDAANFCRNPDHKPTGPWCLTTDPDRKWETCAIPLCSGCKDHRDKLGTDYVGTESFTVYGRACQRWDSQYPHEHRYNDASYFPDETLANASNYCRNPDPATHSVPWCYTTHPDFEWEPCDVALCQDCLLDPRGTDYRGNRATTNRNRPCQRWDAQYPHQHPYTSSDHFPEMKMSEVHNYCRNPDNSEIGPWCYTTDPNVEKEYCGLQLCDNCRVDEKGKGYSGIQSVTKSGRTCQLWTADSPHPHPEYGVDVFPDSSLVEAHNYCRNPNDKIGVGPWCYTTDPDVEWESCEVAMCASSDGDCVYTETGQDYVGTRSRTVSGKVCQGWFMQYPHQHNFTDSSMFPDETLIDAKNYCRNPSGQTGTGPWCLTMDPDTFMESCGISKCLDCQTKGKVYTGRRFVTATGLVCQRWDSQSPHAHDYLRPSMFPDPSVTDAENFCRNPDDRPTGPWCYTTSRSVEQETCGVPTCAGPECRTTDTGEQYTGKRVTTKSGLSCQRWDMQVPHKHPYTDDSMYPDDSVTDAANYCRNPSKDPALGPWCYTTDPSVRLETCAISKCAECMPDAIGEYYVGKQTVTSSGRSCQPWSSQLPHSHPFTNDADFPDHSVSAAENFCRNPDGKPGGPWCFTMDFQVRWEYCGIYSCRECRISYYGGEYRGSRSTTTSGRQCQRWDSQFPHRHNYTGQDFPDPSISDASNYCRNPDRKAGSGPWCFTTDRNVRWESCGVPFCDDRATRPDKEFRQYTGTQAITASGITCQYWSSQKHHTHNFTDPDDFPDPSIQSAVNYCRNPNGVSSGPWCFTMDPNVRWETCGIPLNSDCRLTDVGAEYTGHYRMTVSGRACQRWDALTPHKHPYNESSWFPDARMDDVANYCRNPDGKSTGPWCYTTDPDKTWESCDVPKCEDCKPTYLGTTYLGTRSRTASGHICHRWDEKLPYLHGFTDTDFPDGSLKAANNYCRNPDRDPGGPWCYSIDPGVGKETCGLPLCMQLGRLDTQIGRSYRGHQYLTKTGLLCQRWDRQYPHSHSFTEPSVFPDDSLDEAANYCRNPDNDTAGPWCYTMDEKVARESCAIPRANDCDHSQLDYIGTQMKTTSGLVCQRWTTTQPHISRYRSDSDFPDADADFAKNYCRNPNGTQAGPWCYTMDENRPTESCDIPKCSECRMTYLGYDYQGSISRTMSGRPCQRWDSQIPHRHNMTNPIRFPDNTLKDAANHCRNPDRRPGTGPWCYTDDPLVEWESCAIPICEDCSVTEDGTDYGGVLHTALNSTECKHWTEVTTVRYSNYDFNERYVSDARNYCRNPPVDRPLKGTGPWCHSVKDEQKVSCGIPRCKECKRRAEGYQYTGKRWRTGTGKPCQRWDKTTPTRHYYNRNEYFPNDASVHDAENYCRNPNGRRTGPWCYAADGSGEESCSLPYCSGQDCMWEVKGGDYRGNYAYTVSGRTCMSWAVYLKQNPGKQSYNSQSFPDPSVEEAYNYCRNPDGSRRWLWCYTTDPLLEWEYCPIIYCQDCLESAQTYKGHRAFTMTGRPCQRWDQQLPHAHQYRDSDFPDASMAEAANYCRAPDGAVVPWCFTLDPDVRRENCEIHSCSDCYGRRYGTDYLKFANRTISGRTCEDWQARSPHYHEFIQNDYFPDVNFVRTRNYCRNPNQKQTNRTRPWCFTLDPDVEWEYCDVPMCPSARRAPNCLINSTTVTYFRTDSYARVCRYWRVYHAVVPETHDIDGNILGGKVYDFSGRKLAYRGLVRNGTCFVLASETLSDVEPPTCPYDVDANEGYCNATTTELVPPTDAGQEPCETTPTDDHCCRRTTQVCHSVPYSIDQLPCTDGINLCCAGDCCPLSAECVAGTATDCVCHDPSNTTAVSCTYFSADSVCCDSSACFQNTVCSRNKTECFDVTDVSRYSIRPPQYYVYDTRGERLSNASISCRFRLVAETGYFPEPLYNETTLRSFNYCRNPNNSAEGPWCFIRNRGMSPCEIPFCADNPDPAAGCRYTPSGQEYSGTVNVTLSRRPCQRWDSQHPHTHPYSDPSLFPDASLKDAGSYCRNPDGKFYPGLWCYVDDPDVIWEYCNVPFCEGMDPIPMSEMLHVEPIFPDEESTASASYTNYGDVNSTANATVVNNDGSNNDVTERPPDTKPAPEHDNYTARGWTEPRCDYYLYRGITHYNETLVKLVNNVLLSLRTLPSYDLAMADVPELTLNRTLLEPIEANLPLRCRWCLDNPSGASLTARANAMVADWYETAFRNVSGRASSELERALRRYAAVPWLRDPDEPVRLDEIRTLKAELGAAWRALREVDDRTRHVIGRLREAFLATRDLLQYSWLLQCNKELSKLVAEYANYRTELAALSAEYRAALSAIRSQLERLSSDYAEGEISLERLAQSFDLHGIRTAMYGAKIDLFRLLDVGQVRLQNIREQIGQIYYTIAAYVSPDHLAMTSVYWRHLGVRTPPVSRPELRRIRDVWLPVGGFGVAPDPDEDDFWSEKRRRARVLVGQLERQAEEIGAAIAATKAYFRSYLKGNQIDIEFYRRNFLRVDLFYQDMSDRKVVETKVYEYSNLLSDVGGLMGLLMGASVITIGELMDLIIYNLCKKCKRDREDRQLSKRII